MIIRCLPRRIALAGAVLAAVAVSACASSPTRSAGNDDAAVLSPVGSGSGASTVDTMSSTSSLSVPTIAPSISSTPSSAVVPTTLHPAVTGTTGAPTTTPGTAAPTTAAPPTTVPTTSVPSGWRSQLLSLINAQRATAGVAPLTLCTSLSRAAQDYSGVLAGWGTLSHVGPNGSTLYTRVAAAGYGGYLMVGENLASGQLDAATVVNSWMGSSGHRANLLHQGFTQLGAGRTDALSGGITIPYWVLDLGAGGSC